MRTFFLSTMLLLPSLAHATGSSASTVQSALSLASRPACTLCHSTPNGGPGTATQPFVVALELRGFVLGNTDSLKTAIAALDAEKKDSDADGVSDIDELRAGTDPNVGTGGTADVPEYGCTMQPGAAPSGLLAVMLLALLFWRRRSPNTTAKSS